MLIEWQCQRIVNPRGPTFIPPVWMNLSIFDVSQCLQAVQETFRAMTNTAKMAMAHSKSFRAATDTAG